MAEQLLGIMGRFAERADLIAAAERLSGEGFTRVETFSPYPIEGLPLPAAARDRKVQLIAIGAALAGGLGGYLLEFYAAAIAYPFDVGGRPLNSVPPFMQVVFEMLVLSSALSAFTCVLCFGRLLRWNDPIFAARGIERATKDGLFLLLRADDPGFEEAAARSLFEALGASEVTEVRS